MNPFSSSLTAAFSLLASMDALLFDVVLHSLVVSALACALASSVGLLLGAWLGVSKFKGWRALPFNPQPVG